MAVSKKAVTTNNKVSGFFSSKRFKRLLKLLASLCATIGILALAAIFATNNIISGPKPGFYLDGEKLMKDSDPMITINGIEITTYEYRYFYMSTKTAFEEASSLTSAYWYDDADGAKAKDLKETVEKYIVSYYCVWLSWAQDKGIGLSEGEKNVLEETIKTEKVQESGNFKALLAKNYFADEETYVRIRERMQIITKAQTQYDTELENVEWKDSIVTVKHILIMASDTTDKVEMAEKKKEAEEIYDELMEIVPEKREKAFDNLIYEHSDDMNEEGVVNSGAYTFAPQQADESFYSAALKLEKDEFSEPVESAYGYHIILKLPLDATYVNNNAATLQTAVIESMKTDWMNAESENATIVGGKYYDKVSPKTIK